MASQHGHHIIPKKTLYKVFGALVFLTILTAVTAEFVDIGSLNVPLALAIAVSKATLVATFFMALRYDNKVNTLVFMIGILFVGVFLTFTLADTVFRGDLGNVGRDTISEIDRLESTMRERESPGPASPGSTQPAGESEQDLDGDAGTEAEPSTDVDTVDTVGATSPGAPSSADTAGEGTAPPDG